MPLNAVVELPDSDRAELARWLRAPSMPAGLAQRARIVLLAGDGTGTNEIVTRTGVSKPTVIAWKKRYAAEGLAGLGDRPKRGRPRTTDDVAVVLATLEPPPERLGVTHWSSRLLAAELGLSNVKVADVWREYGLQPWRAETFKFSADPQLEAKLRDVVGLYLNPPDKAVVLCVDEKPQALDGPRRYCRCGPRCWKSAATTPPQNSTMPMSAWWDTAARTPIRTFSPGWPGTPDHPALRPPPSRG